MARRSRVLQDAASAALNASQFNRHNNTFLLGFYSVYASACVVTAAIVFQALSALLKNIEAQKMVLDALDESEASVQLATINDIADQKSKRLQIVLRKVVLNCCVVVVAALFSLLIDSISVAEGMLADKPPPPCPAAATQCDACELDEGCGQSFGMCGYCA
jgi:hypothetical protein